MLLVAGEGVQKSFAHARQVFMMALCQITDERLSPGDITSSRLSLTDLRTMQKKVNEVLSGE